MKIIKPIIFFIISVCIQTLVASAQTAGILASFNVKMDKQWNSEVKRVHAVTRSDSGNVWHKSIPLLKDIPAGYDSVSQLGHYLDYDQVIYQAYKRGDMPFYFLQQVIQKWGVDTLGCTAKTINCFVRAVIAKKGGDWYYILDEDANGSLHNNTPVKLTQVGNKLISNKEHILRFEQFIDGRIQSVTTKILVTSASKADGQFRRLHYQYLERREGDFARANKKYELSLSANFNSFNYLEDTEIRVKDVETGVIIGPFKKGDFIPLTNELLFIEQIKKDGSAITLSSKPVTSTYQSLQKGFVAPLFSGKTLTEETINLSDFKGSYTLIYFWNSTCGASTMRLESSINPLLAKLNSSSSNLKVLGVALDFSEKVQSYINSKKINWPQIVTSANGTIRDLYQINHYPTIYLIDPNGKVLENSLEYEDNNEDLEKVVLGHVGDK